MAGGTRTAALVAIAAMAGTLGACGGQSPYCAAVDSNRSSLDTFGSKRTDAAFGTYATVLTTIGKQAPADSKKQWTTLAKATQGVIAAHEDVGFPLDDMADADKRTALSESDVAELNKAYKAFNGTTGARKAVVADVKKTCDIQLK